MVESSCQQGNLWPSGWGARGCRSRAPRSVKRLRQPRTFVNSANAVQVQFYKSALVSCPLDNKVPRSEGRIRFARFATVCQPGRCNVSRAAICSSAVSSDHLTSAVMCKREGTSTLRHATNMHRRLDRSRSMEKKTEVEASKAFRSAP